MLLYFEIKSEWKFLYMEIKNHKREIAPNLFASVMGTGIIANAAVSLPKIGADLEPFAFVVWISAAIWLTILTVIKVMQAVIRPEVVKRQLLDPIMSQFFGAPPMAFLTISGGCALIGIHYFPPEIVITIGWWLWLIGTVSGLIFAAFVPYLQFTQHEISEDGAFGGWLMPVVSPMVSAAIGALYIPHMSSLEDAKLLLYLCYIFFGVSIFPALIIITLIWRRLSHYGTSGGARVPTLWVVLGPLGQSITAMGTLGVMSSHVLEPPRAEFLNAISSVFGVPVWGFAMYWMSIALMLTVKAIRLRMPFSLTWWAFTFPVGTCVTGTIQLALHTQLDLFTFFAIGLFTLLIVAWFTAAVGTIREFQKGSMLKPATGLLPVVARKQHEKK